MTKRHPRPQRGASPHDRLAAKPSRRTPDIVFQALVVAASLGSALLFLTREKRIAGAWGFSLDDSWIHATFARNIATGHGFSFNPDEPVAGSTAPLYTSILAALFWMTKEMIWSGKAVGILCQAGSALLIYRVFLRMNPRQHVAALFCGLFVALSPPLVWASVSGMEISLYILFLCLGLYFYVDGRGVRASAVWAAGVWVRPDGLFLVALSLLGPRSQLRRKLLVVAPVLATYVAFNVAVGHSALPQTVGTKAHFGVQLAARTVNLIREWGTLWGLPYHPYDQLEHPWLLFPIMVLGAVLTARKQPVLALFWLGLPIAFSLFRENSSSHKRYILHAIPLGMLLATQGMVWVSRRLTPQTPQRVVVGLSAACILWQLAYLDRKATIHGWNVQNINGMEITMAKIASQVTTPGATIGDSDVGAMGYFSNRRVVDLMGLVSKRMTLPENLSVNRPSVIVVDMEWFREYARRDSASHYFAFYDADSTHRYTPLGAVELLHNTICSTNEMVMFQRQGLHDPPVANKFRIRT